MYKLIQKYQKKLLALFAAFLMVVFIIPSTAKMGGGGARKGRVVGHLGKTEVYSTDLERARGEWMLLERMSQPVTLASRTSYSLVMQLRQRPELFYFLQREAANAGITVSDDLVNTVFINEMPSATLLQPEQQDRAKDAVRHLLEVAALHDRMADVVKISQPVIDRARAEGLQSVSLNLVSFTAAEYRPATTQPTTQQAREQFDQYKSVTPVDATLLGGADPFGFGYQVPNRVKVQSLTLPRKALLDAARAAKPPYEWEVAARQYYYEHPEEFTRLAPATTQPAATQPAATQPSTQAASQPSTQPAFASTAPSLRPFAEVKDEISDKLLAPEADKLASTVTAFVTDRMKADWQAYSSSRPATQPATQTATPATQPTTQSVAAATTQPSMMPAEYDSYAYLESLAARVQAQFKLLPEVRQAGDWQDETQLTLTPGIGQARGADFRTFAQGAMADAFPGSLTSPGPRLHLFQPSEPLTDDAKNTYVYRLTALNMAHAPEQSDVAARVEDDVRTKLAFNAALDNAKKLLAAAQTQGLSSAAVAAQKPVTSTGAFRPDPNQPPAIPNFVARPAAMTSLMMKVKAMLDEATPAHPHPVALVEMPGDRKVVVAELAAVTLDAAGPELFAQKLQVGLFGRMQQVEALAQKWFTYDAVTQRLGYTSDEPASASPSAGS